MEWAGGHVQKAGGYIELEFKRKFQVRNLDLEVIFGNEVCM